MILQILKQIFVITVKMLKNLTLHKFYFFFCNKRVKFKEVLSYQAQQTF
jgi:hypothetical protein